MVEDAGGTLRAVDLCCGGGGWAAAARGLPIEWVAVVDWADDCLETWRVNHALCEFEHPECRLLKIDLTSANACRELRDAIAGLGIDLVVGGIPCEELSVARHGKPPSANQIETLYVLIDTVLAIVAEWGPRYWSIEDVVQIEAHLPLPLWHGREIPRRRIDSSRFSPQRRIRTFLGQYPEPVPVLGPRALKDVLRPGPYLCVKGFDTMERNPRRYYETNRVRVRPPELPAPCVIGNEDRHPKWLNIEMPDGRLRRVTFQEMAAMQGFPEDYLFACSYNRATKMIAQAIQIDVGRAILTACCRDAGLIRSREEEPVLPEGLCPSATS